MNRPEPSPSRRRFLALGAGFFAVAALPFARGTRRRPVRRRLPIMGTIAEFAVVCDDPRRAHAALDAAVRELRLVDAAMSRFDASSDVGRVNRAGACVPVPVSTETAEVLRKALAWAEATGGAFDPCLGRATELWEVTRRHAPPPVGEVTRLAGRRLYRALDLDGNRVVVRDADVALDLGGIAKGHAVDRAARALRERGMENALVNVGGDLAALGASEDGDPWRIGVADPADPSRITTTLEVADEAVATSGDYLRFFTYRGRRYHHLLDPETGSPRVTQRHSLTVTAPTCLTADAAATALFGLPRDAAQALLRLHAPAARLAPQA